MKARSIPAYCVFGSMDYMKTLLALVRHLGCGPGLVGSMARLQSPWRVHQLLRFAARHVGQRSPVRSSLRCSPCLKHGGLDTRARHSVGRSGDSGSFRGTGGKRALPQGPLAAWCLVGGPKWESISLERSVRDRASERCGDHLAKLPVSRRFVPDVPELVDGPDFEPPV